MNKRSHTKSPARAGQEPKPESFEIALHRLEEIVSQLERAEAPLEQALALYEEGVKLSRFCSGQLKDAERRVDILEDKNGELRSRPFMEKSQDGQTAEAEAAASDADEDGDEDHEETPSLF